MDAFEKIYSECQPDVYRFLLRLTGGNAQTAEELTQETFYQAFLHFGRFRGECSMKTWLCGIAKHMYGKYLRRETRHCSLEDAPQEERDDSPSAAAQTEQREQIRHIRTAMQQLPEPMRSVAEYRLCSDMSYAEIAHLLNIRENTAAVMCSRAKQKLKEILRKEYGYEI